MAAGERWGSWCVVGGGGPHAPQLLGNCRSQAAPLRPPSRLPEPRTHHAGLAAAQQRADAAGGTAGGAAGGGAAVAGGGRGRRPKAFHSATALHTKGPGNTGEESVAGSAEWVPAGWMMDGSMNGAAPLARSGCQDEAAAANHPPPAAHPPVTRGAAAAGRLRRRGRPPPRPTHCCPTPAASGGQAGELGTAGSAGNCSGGNVRYAQRRRAGAQPSCPSARTSSSPPHSSSFLLSGTAAGGGGEAGGSRGSAAAASSLRRAAAPSFMPRPPARPPRDVFSSMDVRLPLPGVWLALWWGGGLRLPWMSMFGHPVHPLLTIRMQLVSCCGQPGHRPRDLCPAPQLAPTARQRIPQYSEYNQERQE